MDVAKEMLCVQYYIWHPHTTPAIHTIAQTYAEVMSDRDGGAEFDAHAGAPAGMGPPVHQPYCTLPSSEVT